MKTAIVHYHLRRGGVTRVMARAVEGLRECGADTIVLSGEAPPPEVVADFAGTPVVVVPGLSYRQSGEEESGVRLMEEMRSAAHEVLGCAPDVWHIHNHALGKNPTLTHAVGMMAEAGESLLLQPHDFAEDGRPDNYRCLRAAFGGGRGKAWSDSLYPAGENVHYAVLTRRDARVMDAGGVPEGRLHVLANPLELPEVEAARHADPRGIVLYPTRGIRRKNLGEVCLLSVLDPDGRTYVSTLGPENPEWMPVHDSWVRVVREMGLRVDLAAVENGREDFDALVAGATCCVSTSVAEGFGYAFLEPFTWGMGLVGRDLPEITADFCDEGLDLGSTYERLGVPLEWVGEKGFREALEPAMRNAWAAYGVDLEEAAVRRAAEASVVEGRVDFARLAERMQRAVLARCSESGEARARCELPDFTLPDPQTIAANREILSRLHGISAYGEKLARIYRSVGTSEARAGESSCHDGRAVLDSFLAPSRFFLLRS